MKKTPRDVQIQHRLSGAALLGLTRRDGPPPTVALDARPAAGDVHYYRGARGAGMTRAAAEAFIKDITGEAPEEDDSP